MANYYVDARSGNDANTGADWANAKKTIGAAITAYASGSVIYCTGVFYESVILTAAKSLTFNAVGFAILDGKLTLTSGIYINLTTGAINNFNGFTIRNYLTNGFLTLGGPNTFLESLVFTDCVFENCIYGINYQNGTAGWFVKLLRCVVRSCYYGIFVNGNGPSASGVRCTSCTITGNTYGIYYAWNNVNQSLTKCIFSHNAVHILVVLASYYPSSDYNDIDFSSGVCSYVGVAKTTLAAWQAIGGQDSHSISDDPEYVDRTKNVHYLKKTSPAVIGGAILGAYNALLSSGASSNYNTLVWDNPITLTNVEQDANGNYVLSSGYTEGVVEWELDFGSPRSITKIDLIHDYAGLGAGVGGGPNGILDYDESDTLPETWEYRIDTSPDGVSWDGYQTLDLFNNVALTGVQKLRIEATLRTDA